MSFESGSISLRVFKSKPGSTLPDDTVARLAAKAIPSLESIPLEGCSGWATGRHMLDRNITEESAVVASRIRVSLVKAERKIPAALFKAECKQEELASMSAQGLQFLKRNEKAEIAKAVRDRMLPKMPPTLSGTDVVCVGDGCYTTATSDGQVDLFLSAWKETTGQDLVPYTPAAAAVLLGKHDVRSLNPTSFSPDVNDGDVEQDIGTEFLTWLWYFSEACGGMVGDGPDGKFGVALDGPFTFIHEGSGAHEIVVRNGNPGIATEAKSALMAGKKLKKAKLTIARGDEVWSCSFDGIGWVMGSLKLPKSEDKLDASSAFEQRIVSIGTFIGAIEAAFGKFLVMRFDDDKWRVERDGIRQWVADRVGRA